MTTPAKSNPGDVAGMYHLEISQAVQDMENSIPLIRGKRAYARAYFDHDLIGVLTKGVYRAHLHLTSPGKTFVSLNSLTLDFEKPVSRDRQRLNWDQSFNFDYDSGWSSVPDEISTGYLELIPDSGGATIKFEADDRSTDFTFIDSPCLKVTCLLLRYWNAESEDYVMPNPVQVDVIRDFVVSAFPVAEANLEWNTITVQATNDFRSLSKLTKVRPDAEEDASLAIRELLLQATVHRNMDTYTNPDFEPHKYWPNTHDIRTIYLAVFDDPSDQLGGAATDSPKFPVHNIAGAAVVDLNGQIGAHELAHILGREHPGVPLRKEYGPYLGQREEDNELRDKFETSKAKCKAQDREECKRECEKGCKKKYTGFLNFESVTTQGLHISRRFKAPRIYEPNLYFDLLTYRDPQWLSDYSYCGLKERLDKLYQFGEKTSYTTDGDTADGETWVIIGEFDLNRQTGRILFVLPTRYKGLDLQLREFNQPNGSDLPSRLDTYQKITGQLEIKLLCGIEGQKKDVEHKVYHRLPDNGNGAGEKQLDMPNFGIFQATIKTDQLQRIKLQVADNIVDVFEGNSPERAYKYFALLNELIASLQNNTRDEQQVAIRIEDPARYMKKYKNRSLLFYYDVIEDEYYLRFNWLAKPEGDDSYEERRKKLLDSKIISTIQCKRPKNERPESKQPESKQPESKQPENEQSAPDEWVTVMVSSQRDGNVWISPDLINREEYSTDPEFRGKAFYSLLSKTPRSLQSISKDNIEFRILFSAGFDKAILPPITTTAKIHFPAEFLQNREDRFNDQDYSGNRDPSRSNLQNRSGKHRPMH